MSQAESGWLIADSLLIHCWIVKELTAKRASQEYVYGLCPDNPVGAVSDAISARLNLWCNSASSAPPTGDYLGKAYVYVYTFKGGMQQEFLGTSRIGL